MILDNDLRSFLDNDVYNFLDPDFTNPVAGGFDIKKSSSNLGFFV